MGNEQSGSAESFLTKAKGIATPRIIVVSSGSEQTPPDPEKDADVTKLREIPRFYPILRSSLGIAGVKDPPDLFTKFDAKPLIALSARLQEHLVATSEIVAAEQGALGIRVKEIDGAVATLAGVMLERKNAFEKLSVDLQKVREIGSQLKRISASFQQLAPSVAALNSLLPAEHRLPSIDLARFANANFVPQGLNEQKVIDSSSSPSRTPYNSSSPLSGYSSDNVASSKTNLESDHPT